MLRNAQLRHGIADALRGFEARSLPGTGLRAAAVALAITDEGHGAGLPSMAAHTSWRRNAALLVTRRSGALRNHAGQWALPGGRTDAGETPEQAALRELREEIGLHLGPQHVLGRLDDFATRSGYLITPVVVWAGTARQARGNPAEVASIHRIPMEELLRADAPILDAAPAGPHPVLRMPVGAGWIAAPTAAFLYQFREVCLLGRCTRVAHFEQPTFAWK